MEPIRPDFYIKAEFIMYPFQGALPKQSQADPLWILPKPKSVRVQSLGAKGWKVLPV